MAGPQLCYGVALLGRAAIAVVSRLLTLFPVLEVLGLAGLVFLLSR